jgi:hypothetical protein
MVIQYRQKLFQHVSQQTMAAGALLLLLQTPRRMAMALAGPENRRHGLTDRLSMPSVFCFQALAAGAGVSFLPAAFALPFALQDWHNAMWCCRYSGCDLPSNRN